MSNTVLKFSVEAGKDFFHLYDQTGKAGKKNKSGWGTSPNTPLSEVVSAKVNVYPPKSEEPVALLEVFPSLPNADCIGYEVIPEDLGFDSFEPGVWKFGFEVTLHSGVVLAEDCWVFYYQPLLCCIEKKKMKTSLLDASSKDAKKVLELEVLLEKAKDCACSGKKDCAQEISDYIWTSCGCCC
jgi:hypothetical protein